MPLFQGAKQEDIDELKKKLESTVSKDDLTAATAGIGEMKTGLDEIRQALTKLSAPKEEPLPDPGDPTTDLLTDPAGFINKSTKGLQDGQATIQAQVQEIRARQNPKFSGIFAQYGDELVATASKMPAATRAQDGFWEWHVRTVLGDKVIKGELKSANFPSLLGTSTSTPNSTDRTNDPNKGFSQDQADWLKARHPEKEYTLDKASRIAQLIKDGEPITLENTRISNA